MTSRPGKTMTWIILAAVTLAAASLLAFWRMYTVEEAVQRRIVIERGQTILNALAAGIRAQTRMGRYRPERLTPIFDELAQTPGILGLQLVDEGGRAVAMGGTAAQIPNLTPGVPLWDRARFALATKTEFVGREPHWLGGQGGAGPPRDGEGFRGGGPGPFRRGRLPADDEDGLGLEKETEPLEEAVRPPRPEGPPGDLRRGGPLRESPDEEEGMVPWGMGTYTLTVVLDTKDMQTALQRVRMQLGLAAAGALTAIALGMLVVRAQMRHRHLRVELAAANERAAYHEKLAQLGAGLAHETRNPLGVVRGLAQSIEQSPDAGVAVKRMASSIVDEADRTVGQISSFLSLARPKEPLAKPLDLDAFFAGFLPLLQAEAKDTGVAVVYHASGLRIMADEDLLRRLLLNLTINAIKACGERGEVVLEARAGRLSVKDTGCGIAAEDLARVTDPYFGRFEDGTGLGLTIVDQIARGHGWALRIESTPGQGTRVSLDGIRLVS